MKLDNRNSINESACACNHNRQHCAYESQDALVFMYCPTTNLTSIFCQ